MLFASYLQQIALLFTLLSTAVVAHSLLAFLSKHVTELAVNTDTIQDFNLYYPMPPPVLQDAIGVSTITSPPLTSTAGSITDSVEHRNIAALFRSDEVQRVEGQLNQSSHQLDRQQERLAHMTTRVNQLFLENETLRRDLGNTQSRPEDMQKTSKTATDKDRALSMLLELLPSFTESSDRLTAEDCYHFFGLSPQAHPQTFRRQYLELRRLTHPDQHPECPSEVS